MIEAEAFELAKPQPASAVLVVDHEGYVGTIDLLLTLAREKNVDLPASRSHSSPTSFSPISAPRGGSGSRSPPTIW
jgi:hypothetical protein